MPVGRPSAVLVPRAVHVVTALPVAGQGCNRADAHVCKTQIYNVDLVDQAKDRYTRSGRVTLVLCRRHWVGLGQDRRMAASFHCGDGGRCEEQVGS